MGTFNTYTKLLNNSRNWLRKNLVRIHEYKNIHEKKFLIKKVKLSMMQEKEIQDFFRVNYGKKISTSWHRLYQSYTGKYNKEYFPEILFSTELELKLNPLELTSFLGDKNLLPVLFSNIDGLRVPETFISCVRGVYRNGKEEIKSFDDVLEILKNIGHCVIKKTIDTDSGRDVQVCNIVNGIDIKTGQPIIGILKNFGHNYVVQEKIQQHKLLAKLNPTSVNTFRIITYIIDNKVFVCPIALRVGRSNSDKDNMHCGGLAIGVNDDFTLKDVAYSEYGESYYEHPDTKVRFHKYSLPDLNNVETQNLSIINTPNISPTISSTQKMGVGGGNTLKINSIAKQMHARIPWLGVLSYDLTIDEKGYVIVLEVNTIGQGVWFNQMVNGESLFGSNTAKILKMMYASKRKSSSNL